MRRRSRRSTRSPSDTRPASTPSRPTSARSPTSRSCWSASARSCLRSPASLTWRVCSTTRCSTSRTLDRFRTTLAPKAFGAFYLDRLTRDDKLDFFIVSSSVSSLLGSPGQANYSTANALLDGLVADRKAHGLPATGINFGPWGGGGMASSEAASANISAQGLLPLDASGALGALAEVVANGTGQATVLKANWARAAKVLGSSRPPILDLVLPSDAAEVVDSELLKQLQELPVAERADVHHRIPAARGAGLPAARAAARRDQPIPGPGHRLADGGRTPQPVAQPVRWQVHHQRHRGVRLPDDRRAGRVPRGPDAGRGRRSRGGTRRRRRPKAKPLRAGFR